MPGPGLDTIDDDEVRALLEVIRERNLSRYRFDEDMDGQGSFTWRFERELETLSGVRHCLGMNSGTSALLAGMWTAGIAPGDEVIVPGSDVSPQLLPVYQRVNKYIQSWNLHDG